MLSLMKVDGFLEANASGNNPLIRFPNRATSQSRSDPAFPNKLLLHRDRSAALKDLVHGPGHIFAPSRLSVPGFAMTLLHACA